jgi:hypothetical protein
MQLSHPFLSILFRQTGSLAQSLPEQIGEEMMIAIPTPFVVKGNLEDGGGF